MKVLVLIILLGWTGLASAQISAGRALKPLANTINTPSAAMDRWKTNKQTQVPQTSAQPQRPKPAQPAPPPQRAQPIRLQQVEAQKSQIPDKPALADGVSVSELKVIKGAAGLTCSVYVTNNNEQPFVPYAQFAVCDKDGTQIGSSSQPGSQLPAKGYGKIDVSTRLPNAADFKLIKMGGRLVSE